MPGYSHVAPLALDVDVGRPRARVGVRHVKPLHGAIARDRPVVPQKRRPPARASHYECSAGPCAAANDTTEALRGKEGLKIKGAR